MLPVWPRLRLIERSLFRRFGGVEGTILFLAEICNAAGNGRWMDALSTPQPEDESLIGTASPYSHSESCSETEHRREDTKKSGITDEVQVAEMPTVQMVAQPALSDYDGLGLPSKEGLERTSRRAIVTFA